MVLRPICFDLLESYEWFSYFLRVVKISSMQDRKPKVFTLWLFMEEVSQPLI